MGKKTIQSSKKVHNWSNNPLKNKFIIVPTALFVAIAAVAGPKYAPQIKEAIIHAPIFGQRDQKLVMGKQVKLEYDGYKMDRYDRVLAYPSLSDCIRQKYCR